jgi:hypothetical protein
MGTTTTDGDINYSLTGIQDKSNDILRRCTHESNASGTGSIAIVAMCKNYA